MSEHTKNEAAVALGRLGGSRKHPGKGFGSQVVRDKAIATRRLRAEEKRLQKAVDNISASVRV